MGQIRVEKNMNGIAGLCVIEPAVHGDVRGYFMETYNKRDMREAGIDVHFVQDNQSMSTKGVLRGLHFQKKYPQCKLVRVVRARGSTWRWICAPIPKLMGNGTASRCQRKIRSNS